MGWRRLAVAGGGLGVAWRSLSEHEERVIRRPVVWIVPPRIAPGGFAGVVAGRS